MSDILPWFRVFACQSLIYRAGSDSADVTVGDGSLVIQGTDRRVEIPFRDIVRVRFGTFSNHGRHYQVQVWEDDGAPMLLRATPDTRPAYAEVARALAGGLLPTPAAVETGMSWRAYLLWPIAAILSLPIGLAVVLAMPGQIGSLWLVGLLLALLPALGILSLLVSSSRPRVIHDLGALERVMPSGSYWEDL